MRGAGEGEGEGEGVGVGEGEGAGEGEGEGEGDLFIVVLRKERVEGGLVLSHAPEALSRLFCEGSGPTDELAT